MNNMENRICVASNVIRRTKREVINLAPRKLYDEMEIVRQARKSGTYKKVTGDKNE